MIFDYFLIIILVICLYTDLCHHKIYNKVLIPATIFAITGSLYLDGFNGGVHSVKGLLLGMGLLFIPFICGGIGGGDVKLLGVIGAFKGPEFVWIAFLATAIIGGFLSLIILGKRGLLKAGLTATWATFLSFLSLAVFRKRDVGIMHTGNSNVCTNQTFPYAIAITAGTILVYFLR